MPANDMFPPDPDLPLLHTRRYEVRAFRMADDRFMLRGVVCDEKPAGVYVSNDPDPLWMHLMVVDLEITYPTFVIEKASVEFKNHPHLGCTDITDHYKKLEGMSISRGFNAKGKGTICRTTWLHTYRCIAFGNGTSGDTDRLVNASFCGNN